MTELLAAFSRTTPAGAGIALKIFFCFLEALIIFAGIYLIRCREKLFGYKGKEDDTYASANLRLAMLVLIWVHAVIVTGIMIFEI